MLRQMSEARATSSPSRTDDSPLSGLVSTTANGRLEADHTYRRYAGRLDGSFQLGGKDDTCQKRVMYEIGRVFNQRPRMCANRCGDEERVGMRIDVSTAVMTDLIGICKKFTATPPNFRHVDLSYVGEKLGRALAAFVQTGALSCADIRGNQPLSVRAVSVRDSPVNPDSAHVLIPRAVDVNVPGTFAVLTACVNGAGATVYTDEIAVDAQNRVVLAEPVDAFCALAVCNGMHVLMAMYESCGQGTTMAYAIARGLHSVATVVGHSDEGGWTRDVFRHGGFIRPYGGISVMNGGIHMPLPMPTVTSESTFVAFCDSMLLGTAGLAARADPCVTIEGKVYPTIMFAPEAARLPAGGDEELGLVGAASLKAQLAQAAGPWAANYVSLLGELFVTSGGDPAMQHIIRMTATAAPTRHLEFPVIAPYYWIEPTTLFRSRGTCPADVAGYGPIAGTLGTYSMPWFEKCEVSHSFGGVYALAVQMRTMRTSGLVIALMDHPQNGLGAIRPIQFMEDKAMLKGGANNFAEARAAGDTLDMYHWVRRQSQIPHPAAFTYLGRAIGLQVVASTFEQVNFNVVVNHVPKVTELSGQIEFKAYSPQRVTNGGLNWAALPRDARRARSLAAESLMNARMSSWGMQTGGEVIARGNFEPHTIFPGEAGVIDRPIGEAQRSQRVQELRDEDARGARPVPHVILDTRQRFSMPRPGGGRVEAGGGDVAGAAARGDQIVQGGVAEQGLQLDAPQVQPAAPEP